MSVIWRVRRKILASICVMSFKQDELTMPSKTRKELERNTKAIQKEDTQLRSTLTKSVIPWFATLICLLPFMISTWFDSSSSAVEGIQYYEHNTDVSISDYIAMYDETPEILCDPSDTPRVVVMYAGECGFPNNSTQVVKELVDSAYKGYHVAFFTEQWSES